MQTNERSVKGISQGTVYTLSDFKKITGMKTTAVRTARQKGLKIYYVGNRAFVFADSFLDYIKTHGKESEPKK